MSEAKSKVQELLDAASGANFYWSRIPGKFVNKETGEAYLCSISFNGSVREWYETLVETIHDVSNNIERKIGTEANFCIVSPDVATILECSVLHHHFCRAPEDFPTQVEIELEAAKVGALLFARAPVVYQHPGMPRNRILVGCEADGHILTDPASCGSVTVVDLFVG